MQLHACPYPGTCRYYGEEKGAPRCRRGTCPFRIHLRRMVAGEMQRLAGKGGPYPSPAPGAGGPKEGIRPAAGG